MKLIRSANMILKQLWLAADTPGRGWTQFASIGLLAGVASLANCAVPEPAVVQDHDPVKAENFEVIVLQDGDGKHEHLLKKLQTEHGILLHKLDSDKAGNVEVIVIGDEDSDENNLPKKLGSELKLRLNKPHAGDDKNIEVVIVQDDENEKVDVARLHKHLVELLPGHGPNHVDHHALAKQLRDIADLLEGMGESGHAAQGHQEIEIHPGDGKKLMWHAKEGDADQNVFLHKIDVERMEKGHDQPHVIVRSKKGGNSRAVIVEEVEVDRQVKPHATDRHSGGARTSEESQPGSIEDLKSELEQLRKELDQLRAKRSNSSGKRLRLKQEESSSDDDGNQPLVWVEEGDSDNDAKRLIWKATKDAAVTAQPNRFRFEFKKKDQESADSDDDN